MKKILILILSALMAVSLYAGVDYKEVYVQKTKVDLYSAGPSVTAFGAYTLYPKNRWGGGVEGQYFLTKHFSIGIEGFAINASPKTKYAGLLTGTARLPMSHFAPYVFIGGGGINDGNKFMGQAGGGLEYNLAPQIGIKTDYSWNMVDKGQNFGMLRTGLDFQF